ncbi:sensor histidine kinase [Streptococcus halotolerans]|uniref:sensor histidine kinase n=1 Tax=Streptococcus halotolerans TaxID=1814128 RepID=UPI0007897CBE|nr:HAMP domain-containing sensor histidine kinase [Streptococcus halotolerans]
MTLRYYLITGHLIAILITLIGVFIGLNYMVIEQKQVFFIMAIVITASLLGALFSLLLLSKITTSLSLLIAKMDALSRRDFQTDISITSPQEFAHLDLAFSRMAQSLEESFASLTESEREKALMIAQLSHDIKTPITSIQSEVEGILDGIIPPEDTPRYLKAIHGQTGRLNHLVKELDFLTSEVYGSDKENEVLETIYLDKLIIDVLSEFHLQITDEERDIAISVLPESAYIMSHYHKLYRILQNLVSNAFKYSPAKTPISIDLIKAKEKLTITVTDKGIGIGPEHQSKIFNRLYRVESSRNMATGGHGLGLYIAQELAQQLGGFISVDSQKAKGSKFSLSIPLKQEPKNQTD